jgi:hypothetical protein
MTKFFKVYSGPGYPVDPQLEKERAYADLSVFTPEHPVIHKKGGLCYAVVGAKPSPSPKCVIAPFHADNEGKLRFQTWLADQRN